MTPYELSVLIHHYVSPGLFSQPDTDLYKQLCTRFVFDGLFSVCPQQTNGYLITDLGKAWLRVILKTPVPTLAYVDINGKPIKID